MEENRLNHIGIIMDGNRRWGKIQGAPCHPGPQGGRKGCRKDTHRSKRTWHTLCLTICLFYRKLEKTKI